MKSLNISMPTFFVIFILFLNISIAQPPHWRGGTGNPAAGADAIVAGTNNFGTQAGNPLPINILTGGKTFAQFTVNNGLGAGIPGNNANSLGDGLSILNQSGGSGGGMDLWCDANTIGSNGTHIKFDGSGLIQGAANRFEIIGNYDGLWLNARRTASIATTDPKIIFNIDNTLNANVHNNNEVARFGNSNGNFRGWMRIGLNPNNFEAARRVEIVDGAFFPQFRITQSQTAAGVGITYTDFQATPAGDLVIIPFNSNAAIQRRNVGIHQVSPTNTLEINSNSNVIAPLASPGIPTRSGLKFTNLNATLPVDAGSNSGNTVLSVNDGGDVILVRGGTLQDANNGLTLSTVPQANFQTVVLGQNYGQAGNVGQLISNREIPLNGKDIIFTQTTPDLFTSGKVGFGISPGNGPGNALRQSNITMQVNGSISLFDGNGNTSLFFGENTVANGNLGQWGIHYDDAAGNSGLNFWRPSGSGSYGFGNRFLFLGDNGNVGIGALANVLPQNALEITSYPNQTPAGLRFTNLNSGSVPQPTNGKVLSVNGNGDVILVPDNVGQAIGTCNSPTQLNVNAGLQLNGINFYFLDGTAGLNSVGIGIPCTSLSGKLSIDNVTQPNGITSSTNFPTSGSVYGAIFNGTGSTYANFGLRAQAMSSTQADDIGVYGLALGTSGKTTGGQFFSSGLGLTYGVHASASGGLVNCGVWSSVPGGVGSGDYAGYFDGDIFCTKGNYTMWSQIPSDSMLKKNISSFSSGLNVIRNINLKSFNYNGKAGLDTSRIYFGVIAEELKQIAPYAVDSFKIKLDSTDGLPTSVLCTKSDAIVYTSINAIKQLDSAVTALQNNPGVSGSGTANYLTKWSGVNTVGSSLIYDNGSNVGIGINSPSYALDVNGSASVSNDNKFIVKNAAGTGIAASLLGNNANEGALSLGSTTQIHSNSGELQFFGNSSTFFHSMALSTGQPAIDFQNTNAGGKRVQIYTNANGIRFNDVTGNSTFIFGRNDGATTDFIIDGTGNVGIGTSSPTEKLYVVGNIYATGTITQNSDANLKENQNGISNALSIIDQLNPKTYNFKTAQYPQLNLPSGNQYGLIAQEVESVLPDVVVSSFYPEVKDTSGNTVTPRVDYKGINYTALIPILIEAVKEQQAQITALQGGGSKAINNDKLPSSDAELISASAAIWQNFPNPFGDGTVIRYFVPEKAASATLVFTDEFGNEVKSVALPYKGTKAELNLSTANLSSGIYSYSLVVDGKIVDTKKMIKSK